MSDAADVNRERALALERNQQPVQPQLSPNALPPKPAVSRGTGAYPVASVGDVAIASLADDPEARMNYYSQEMGIPRDRFGMIDGDIVYKTDDGNFQAVAPGFIRGIAKQAGPAIPMLSGTAGAVGAGLLALPSGPGAVLAATGGGVTGAVAGQGGREYLASELMGQEFSPYRVARAGAEDLIASVTGLLIAKGLTGAAAKQTVARMEGYMKQAGVDEVNALRQAAADHGIQLTPAELTNIGKLRGGQRALSSLPESSAGMEDFYTSRADDVAREATGLIESVSPKSGDVAAEALQSGAQAAIQATETLRGKLGSPVYEKAFRNAPPMDLAPIVDLIDAKMSMAGKTTRKALKAVRNEMFQLDETGKRTDVLIDDLETIQNRVKEEIDNLIEGAPRKTKSALMDVKTELLAHLDEGSPTYAKAREIWEALSKPVTAAEYGPLANPATAKTAKAIAAGPGKLFTESTPDQLRKARAMMVQQRGGEDAWNAGLRAYLEGTFDKAGKVAMSNVARPQAAKASQGVRWWAELMGDSRQKARLRASMTNEQWAATNKLMSVLEATGRALDFNSDTAFKQEFVKDLRKEAGKGFLAHVDKVNVLAWARMASEAFAEHRFGKNTEQLAKAITSPDAVKEMAKLRGVSTRSAQAFIAAARVLGIGGKEAFSQVLPPPDQMPIGP